MAGGGGAQEEGRRGWGPTWPHKKCVRLHTSPHTIPHTCTTGSGDGAEASAAVSIAKGGDGSGTGMADGDTPALPPPPPPAPLAGARGLISATSWPRKKDSTHRCPCVCVCSGRDLLSIGLHGHGRG